MNSENKTTIKNIVVVKRSGQRVNFNKNKIAIAIKQAFDSVLEDADEYDINKIHEKVLKKIEIKYKGRKTINVEDIQNEIEEELKNSKYLKTYEHFKTYRQKRTELRKICEEKQDHKFLKTVEKLNILTQNDDKCFSKDIKTKFGKIISKEYAKSYVLENKTIKLLEEGIIKINQIDEYITTKTQGAHLDISKLEEENLEKYTDKLIKNICKYKKEQYGEQTIPSIDYIFINIIIKEFKITLKNTIKKYLKFQGILNYINFEEIEEKINQLETIYIDKRYFSKFIENKAIENIIDFSIEESLSELKEKINNNFKKLLIILEENLEEYKSKITISLGTNNKTPEAELIRILYLKAILELKTLKNINTIYKINKINEEELMIIYSLIKKQKNIYILFENKNKTYEEEQEIFSTGERIYKNITKQENNSLGRILLSTTTINIARLGLEYKEKNKKEFYNRLKEVLEIVKNQLIQRFELQGNKYKEDYENLFKDNIIYESNKLEKGQKIRKTLRNGVLNISLIGLYECSASLNEKEPQKELFEILKYINTQINNFTKEEKLNFIISESYDKKMQKEFISLDKAIFGKSKIINKEKYEDISKIYTKNKTKQEEKTLETLGKYQEMISSVIEIKVDKNQTFEEFQKLIENMQKNKIIFTKIKI